MKADVCQVIFSAFFTDIIGIHPIFGMLTVLVFRPSLPDRPLTGGFLAGLVIPKTNGFDIALVEKLEDFISLLFLPQV